MLTYKEFEEAIYNWLEQQHQKNPAFTFSLRKKAVKGAENDFFIGTEKSAYFSTTFWTIPTYFPGSSADLLGVHFSFDKENLRYQFYFYQTNDPTDAQNRWALELIQRVKSLISAKFGLSDSRQKDDPKMEMYKTAIRKKYTSISTLLNDLEHDIIQFLTIIDTEISNIQLEYPEFKAHRITMEEFNEFKKGLDRRQAEHSPSGKNLINVLKKAWSTETGEISKFSFGIDGLDKKIYYLWLADPTNIIKDSEAHYELMWNNEIVELFLHFESKVKKEKDKYGIIQLPANYEWVDWHKSKSIKYTTRFSLDDPELSDKIKEALLDFDKSVGVQVRKIKKTAVMTKATALNTILFGPPGTGKTYNTINKALQIINEEEEQQLDWDNREAVKAQFDKRLKEGRIAFVTFHQSMSYEDFVEGIKPVFNNTGSIQYQLEAGIFKRICEAASNPIAKNEENSFDKAYDNFVNDILEKEFIELETPAQKRKFEVRINSNKTCVAIPKTAVGTQLSVTKSVLQKYVFDGEVLDWKPYTVPIGEYFKKNYPFTHSKATSAQPNNAPYVLIIDEINRGNVSQIFGELITLIEEDKRLGREEALEVKLPYSKTSFGVPPNLYIIGTMNTADRSVEALDTALRRRFSFEEMPPLYELGELKNDLFGFPASEILRVINDRIELLLDKDHLIGHAYFLNKTDETFITAFYKNIIPLLQEYFYGDYGKIGLVLGRGFVEYRTKTKDKNQNNKNILAAFEDIDSTSFEERRLFSICDHRNNPGLFQEAINTLMENTAYVNGQP